MKRQVKSIYVAWLFRSILIIVLIGIPNSQLNAQGMGDPPPDDAPTEVETILPEITASAVSAEVAIPSLAVAGIAPGSPAWVPQGPGPSQNGQVENVTPNNEVVGAIHTVAAHPSDPNILYAGAVNGGVWKTTNATAASPTWTPLTDFESSLSTGALEFDPADENRLIAGIGRFSSFARVGGALSGLLLTTDGGATWTSISDPLLVDESISGVAARGNLLLASANGISSPSTGGLFRSTDNGVTWNLVSGTNGFPIGGVFDLVGDPNNANRFYASVGSNGIYHSSDGGMTWTNISGGDATLNGVITQFSNNNTEMAVAGNGRLYAAVLLNGQAQYIGFTDNQGTNWTAMDLPQTQEGNGDIEGLNPREKPGGQGAIHFSIRADPTNSNIVYVGGDRQDTPFPNFIGAQDFSGRLFRGDTTVAPTAAVPSPQWQHLTHNNGIAAIPGGGTANSSSPHADSREMVFDAQGDIIEVDDGGIYRRTNPANNTGDWFSINGNIQTTEFHDVTYDSVSNIIIGGAQDTGTPEQITPGGTTWRSVSTADGGGTEVDDSQAGMSIRYSSFQNLGAFRRRTYDSNNILLNQAFPPLTVVGGGAALVPQFYTPVKLNAVDPTRLIIGGANSVYESLDQGNTISEIGIGIRINDGLGAEAIAYGGRQGGADSADVLYVGAGAQVFIRTAAAPAALTASATYPGGVVRDIVLDPDDWMTAYVADNNQVFMTSDAGTSWTDITGDLVDDNLRAIALVPAINDMILVGGRNGVFRMLTANSGSWATYGTGLPRAIAYDLDYDAADEVLAVGTLGRGAWLADVEVEATVHIVKRVDAQPDGSFDDDPSGWSFDVIDDGQPLQVTDASGMLVFTMQAGTYNVSETTGPDGFWLVTASCVDDNTGALIGTSIENALFGPSLPAADVTNLSLEPGQSVTCTFDNQKMAGFVTGGGQIITNRGKNGLTISYGGNIGVALDGSYHGQWQTRFHEVGNTNLSGASYHSLSIESVVFGNVPGEDPNPPDALFNSVQFATTGRLNDLLCQLTVSATDHGEPARGKNAGNDSDSIQFVLDCPDNAFNYDSSADFSNDEGSLHNVDSGNLQIHPPDSITASSIEGTESNFIYLPFVTLEE